VGGAGGAVLGTLGDVYANPVMLDALIHSREGTSVTEKPLVLYDPAPPDIDDPAQMERWDQWVRAYIAIGETRSKSGRPFLDRTR
jgi:hypothetical protein